MNRTESNENWKKIRYYCWYCLQFNSIKSLLKFIIIIITSLLFFIFVYQLFFNFSIVDYFSSKDDILSVVWSHLPDDYDDHENNFSSLTHQMMLMMMMMIFFSANFFTLSWDILLFRGFLLHKTNLWVKRINHLKETWWCW